MVGPVGWSGALPFSPPAASPLERARHAVKVWRTIRDIDRAAGGAVGGFDLRVFFLCAPLSDGQLGFAEGSGAVNGEVAFVRGSCDGDLSLSLQTIGHELFHTVGATDRYDSGGHARVPDGLADPARVPLTPSFMPSGWWERCRSPRGAGGCRSRSRNSGSARRRPARLGGSSRTSGDLGRDALP